MLTRQNDNTCDSSPSLPPQDTFDVRILMARTVKYTINFMEVAEEDLHRSADATNLLLIFHFCN